MPQRRKRVFIFGYKKSSKIHKELKKEDNESLIYKKSLFAKSFPIVCEDNDLKTIKLDKSLQKVSKSFGKEFKTSFFENTGIVRNGEIFTTKTTAKFKGKKILLKDILLKNKEVSKEFYIDAKDLRKWKYLKGSKKQIKVTKDGREFIYSEGAMSFPDSINKPSRTIITAEGGSTPSRFKHIIKIGPGKYRRLMPIELERLSMFPDNHTAECSDTKRAFFIGNALVVGIVEKIAIELGKKHISN